MWRISKIENEKVKIQAVGKELFLSVETDSETQKQHPVLKSEPTSFILKQSDEDYFLLLDEETSLHCLDELVYFGQFERSYPEELLIVIAPIDPSQKDDLVSGSISGRVTPKSS